MSVVETSFDRASMAGVLRSPGVWLPILALGLLILSDHPAAAHIVGRAAGFSSGFEHPLTGCDHFLAMLSVGLWGAQMGGRSVWTLPVTFPLIMALGGIAGMAGLPMPDVELGIALSIMVLGAAIAACWRPNPVVALALIAVFAVFHGYAHGAELPRAADPADYAVGFVLATGMIHVLGVGVGLFLSRSHKGVPVRMLGGAIALGGVAFLVA